MQRKFWSLWALLICTSLAQAGWVETLDGSRINGSLVKIDDTHVEVQTAFAGVLRIPRTQVMKMDVQGVVILRTEQGDVIEGNVRSDSLGRFRIDDGQVRHRVHWRSVTSAWRPGAEDPLMDEDVGEPMQVRKWNLQLSFDLRGRTGNTERLVNIIRVNARREGPHDRLDLYGSYNFGTLNGVRSDDEIIMGTRYTSFPQGRIGWFVREELERDRFEGIHLRSTTAAGASFRFIFEPDLKWEGSSGLSNRYENYRTGGDDNALGLDLGMTLTWDFNPKVRLRSRMNYLPALDNMSEFFFEQDSGLEIPISARNFWRLQVGVHSRYNSRPPSATARRLDTEYYTRLVLSWD
ncbi:MAG: DUF481 domain-containing protein [Opitutales bacterium]|nr:DUF481 domain-containing protein [Opitutales bacterium]